LGEIDAIYEQFGSRMAHVNQLLSHLPAAAEAPPTAGPAETPVHAVDVHVASGASAPLEHGSPAVTHTYVGLVGPALPAPAKSEPAVERAGSLTFQPFAAQIHAGETAAAGRSLAELFGLPQDRGAQCAAVFAERMRSEPGFLRKAVELRDELQSGGWQEAVSLLWECFGLSGLEALGVLQTLRSRLPHEE
jgi:hypothetical protein